MRVVYANICGGMIFAGREYGQFVFSRHSLGEHISFLKEQNTDILCLNEVHLEGNDSSEMVERISAELGLPYYSSYRLSDSHLAEGKGLGVAIVSKYPLLSEKTHIIKAPHLETVRENGEKWALHDKGALSADFRVAGHSFRVVVFDYFPFHHFGFNSENSLFDEVRGELISFLKSEAGDKPLIVAGDLNNKNVKPRQMLHEVLDDGILEMAIEAQSTLVGMSEQFDIIMYSKNDFTQTNVRIDRNHSDHFSVSVDLFPAAQYKKG